jgi:hypothetical protein
MLNHHSPVQILIGPPEFNPCHDLLNHNLLQISLSQLIIFVSDVPAGQLADDLFAILVSTSGHIPMFPSKMHLPSALY